MAEIGHDMDDDPRPDVPPHGSERPQLWDISKLGETITASLNQLLDLIRRAVREEVEAVLSREQRLVSTSVLGGGPVTQSLSATIR